MIKFLITNRKWYKYSNNLRSMASFLWNPKFFNLKKTKASFLCVWLADDENLRQLNITHRNLDKICNILSFVNDEYANIAMAYECIRREKFGLKARSSELLIHGILHTWGYDHEEEEDALNMEQLEADLMQLWKNHRINN